MRSISRRSACALMLGACAAMLTGCVDQHPQGEGAQNAQAIKDAELGVTGKNDVPATGNAEAVAKKDARVVATSPAIAEICDRLGLDLVGVPETSSSLPERYQGIQTVGAPMAPDMEKLASMQPDYVLSPMTLRDDLQPKYTAAGLSYLFLDLRSLAGMYGSIEELGVTFGREQKAGALKAQYESFTRKLEQDIAGFEKPKVLLLMGVPGSYLVAAEHSYAGSLVAQAGGVNVYEGSSDEFLNVNIEDMLSRDPDIILRTAHALPDEVKKMFAEEFETNLIWKHFRAVQEGRVFDLSYENFGMSASFAYPEAFDELKACLYDPSPKKVGE